jgi:hypothetical protein
VTLSVKLTRKEILVAVAKGFPETEISLTAGATAFETTVVVLSVSVSVPSFKTTVKVVVSEVALLLSVGLKLKALKVLCKEAGALLLMVYGPVPFKPLPDKTPLALESKVMVAEILSPSASVVVIEEKGAIVLLSFTA